jgi:hypothetical protein
MAQDNSLYNRTTKINTRKGINPLKQNSYIWTLTFKDS